MRGTVPGVGMRMEGGSGGLGLVILVGGARGGVGEGAVRKHERQNIAGIIRRPCLLNLIVYRNGRFKITVKFGVPIGINNMDDFVTYRSTGHSNCACAIRAISKQGLTNVKCPANSVGVVRKTTSVAGQ